MEFVLDNGSIRVALSTAGGSFTSIAANGREYLWQGTGSLVGPGTYLLPDLRRSS